MIKTADLQAAFPDIHITDQSEMYTLIDEHKSIYKHEPPWNKVKKTSLSKGGTRKISLLNAGNSLCDELVAISFSEQFELSIENEATQKYVNKILEDNSFWDKFPELLNKAYALGGGIVKLYLDNGKPTIDYVDAENFYPTAWNNKRITQGLFISHYKKGDNYYTLFEQHTFNNNHDVHINNILYKSQDKEDIGKQCELVELFPNINESVDYNGIKEPLFSYIHPSTTNNVIDNTPLGLSVFETCKDTLKQLDLRFDNFDREFVLGKKRISLPTSAIQSTVDTETGERKTYFDPDDEAYQAFSNEDNGNTAIQDNTTDIRVNAYVDGINFLLNILCMQTGLSAGTLSFNATEGMKTATEVISQNSKTARTAKAYKNLLVENLEDIVHAIINLGVNQEVPGVDSKTTVTIGLKDNIIIDDNTLIDNNIKLVDAGLKSKIKAIMEVQKCDEAEAQKELEAITKEQSINGLDVDDFYSKGEETSGDE